MNQYKHILVATDFSAIGDQAASQANGLATLLGAKLTIIHVVEHFPEELPEGAIPPENVDPKTFFNDQAHTQLEKLCISLGCPDAMLDVLISNSSAAKEIAEYARNKSIDFIVIGAHGKREHLGILGSTASRIMSTATVDVLVVHAKDQENID